MPFRSESGIVDRMGLLGSGTNEDSRRNDHEYSAASLESID